MLFCPSINYEGERKCWKPSCSQRYVFTLLLSIVLRSNSIVDTNLICTNRVSYMASTSLSETEGREEGTESKGLRRRKSSIIYISQRQHTRYKSSYPNDIWSFYIHYFMETSNPKGIAKRMDEILILQVNQWPNMTSLGRGRKMSQTEEPRLTLADTFPAPFTPRHITGTYNCDQS